MVAPWTVALVEGMDLEREINWGVWLSLAVVVLFVLGLVYCYNKPYPFSFLFFFSNCFFSLSNL